MPKAKILEFPAKIPFDQEAEQSVIGGILLDNQQYPRVAEILEDTDFFNQDLQFAFRAVSALFDHKEAIDSLTLKNTMSAVGFDAMRAAQLIAEVVTVTPESANCVLYAKIVRRHSLRRQAIAQIEKAKEALYADNEDPEAAVTIIGDLAYDFDKLAQQAKIEPEATKVESITAAIIEIESGRNQGFATGFPKLDSVFGGLVPGELTILAGRTSQGKTALGCNIAFNMAKEGLGSAYFTLEMSQKQLWSRLIALSSGVDTFSARRTGFTPSGRSLVDKARTDLVSAPLDVFHSVALTPKAIARQLARIRTETPLRAIFVDYLGLMHGDRNEKAYKARWDEMGGVVRDLREVAGKYDLALVLLCQLNREGDDDQMPRLSQLRDTGVAEEHAGNVLFVWKPAPEKGAYQTRFIGENEVQVVIAKQRCGPAPCTIDFLFDKTIGRFVEVEGEPF